MGRSPSPPSRCFQRWALQWIRLIRTLPRLPARRAARSKLRQSGAAAQCRPTFMIRFLIIRLVLPLLVLLLVRSLLKSVFSGFRTYTATQSQHPAEAATAVPAGGELKKDPV